MLWKIMKQDDGTYRIKIADEDPLYGAESDKAQALIGVGENDFGVNPLIIPGSAESVNAGFDWKFVAEDAYEVYIAKKDLQEQLDRQTLPVSRRLPIMSPFTIRQTRKRKTCCKPWRI